MSKRYNYKVGTLRRKWHSENIPLKAWHHLKLKVKQLFCIHGSYVYLDVTTQRKEESGNVMVFARGCKKCAWISTSLPYAGMPRILRNSYDETYLKITDKHDVLKSEVNHG